ncbi:dienelactone hydrolase family protein [Mycobacterium sp. UM_Kg1]|uniref:dienelactone hydrolase family protein n=1 Tax=Mycobacterium sp. UM_Kg1 TaxID=1545691 RepID=UPI00061A9A90|nr:dienelactone hydrolase family protein [Mycobacterium sp. UM_Kg1]
MTTIDVDAPAGPVQALLDVPEGSGPWPGVVLVHDAIGYGADMRAVSRRVAAAGYLALSPNLYSRGGRARCITRVFRELLTQRGRALEDILAARDHLLAMPECSGAVGIAGDRLRAAVEKHHIPHDIKVYRDAGHSFANRLPAQPLLRIAGYGYNEAATADAWNRVFAFFAEHLRPGA